MVAFLSDIAFNYRRV